MKPQLAFFGAIVLAIWLILEGLTGILGLTWPARTHVILSILQAVAGVLILLGK